MIAYRVVAVPERLERAERLAARLDGQVVLDENHDGTFFNHLRALRSVGHATHVVVLEDDAILCPDFTAHVGRVIRERPGHLLGLYVGRAHPRKPQPILAELTPERAPWLDHPQIDDRLRWAVGYVMPVADIPDVLEGLGGSQHKWVNTDGRLGRWHASRHRLSYPFPSLVDHDDALPSTTSSTGHGRVAWSHCGGSHV